MDLQLLKKLDCESRFQVVAVNDEFDGVDDRHPTLRSLFETLFHRFKHLKATLRGKKLEMKTAFIVRELRSHLSVPFPKVLLGTFKGQHRHFDRFARLAQKRRSCRQRER